MEILSESLFSRNRGDWDQNKSEELIIHEVLGSAQHPYLAFEDRVGLGDADDQVVVEFWVLAPAIDDPGRDGVVWIVGEGEFGIHVLLLVDAYVVDVPGVMNMDFKNP